MAETTPNESEDVGNKLNEALKRRPSAAQIQETNPNIMPYETTTTAAAIQPSAHALEKKLANRRSKLELAQQNILDGSGQAPSMVAAKQSLVKRQTEKALTGHLKNRPDSNDLVQRHILADQSIDPSLQARVIAMRQQQIRQSLANNLEKRPEYEELLKNENILSHAQAAPAIRGTAYDLEQKLGRRPSTQEVSQYFHQDNKQAASIQPAAYALQKQLGARPSVNDLEAQNILGYGDRIQRQQDTTNFLEGKLQNRPTYSELQKTSNVLPSEKVAASMQPAAHNILNKIGQRPTAEQLAARNILAQQSQGRFRRASQNLGNLLANRPDEYQIPAHIFHESQHQSVQSGGQERFRRASQSVGNLLQFRPQEYEIPNNYFMPAVEVQQTKRRKSKEEPDYNEFEANFGRQFTIDRPKPHEVPNKYFHEPKLSQGAQATLLEQQLRARPSVADLAKSGIYEKADVSRSIAGVAAALEKKLGRDVQLDDLLRAGINPEYLFGLQSRALQPAAKRISHFLEQRVSEDELMRRNILHKGMDPSARHDRVSMQINPVFQTRKDPSQLNQRILHGGLDANMASSIKPAAHALEQQLRNRRDSQDLFNQNILKVDPNSAMHPALAKFKYEEQQRQKRQTLENALANRSTFDELQRTNIAHGTSVNDTLGGKKYQMEQNFKKRKLEEALNSRREEHEIPSQYFIQPKRKRKKKVRKRRVSEYIQDGMEDVGYLIRERPDPTNVPDKYFRSPKEKKVTAKSALKEKFKKRQSALDLHQRGLLLGNYADGYAPVDLANQKKSSNREIANVLKNSLKRRPSQADLQSQGILYQNQQVAPSIQGAAVNLEKKLRRRASVDELAAKNILKKLQMAPHLQARAEELRKNQLEKRLDRKLSLRPDKHDLVNRGYLPQGYGLTGDQLARKQQLEMAMKKSQLSDKLASRPRDFELSDKIFMEYIGQRDAARSRRKSEFIKNKEHDLMNALNQRPDYFDIDAKVFHAPSRKRRLSEAHEQIAQALEGKLMHRPEKEEISENMWITAKDLKGSRGRRVSYSMKKHQEMMESMLNKKQHYDEIAEKRFREPTEQELLAYQLSQRKTRQELERDGIISPYSNRLAGSAMAIEKNLKRRPTIDQLQLQNVLQGYGYMDPEMMRQKAALDKRMKQERLNSQLQYRPSKSELAERGIVDDSGLAPRLHGAAYKLNQKLVSGNRRSRADLLYTGVLNSHTNDLSNALAPAAHSLEKKMKRRMSIDQVQALGIIDSKRDPKVYAATKDLERRRKSKMIDNVLLNRPDKQKLIERGIYSEHKVADGLQSAAQSISSHLKRRPSQADVAHIMKANSGLVSKKIYEEQLEDFLAARPLPSDLKRRSILPGVPIDKNLDEYKWIENRQDLEELQRKIEESKRIPDRNYQNKAEEVRGISKDRMRRLSTTLDVHLRNRPDKESLADKGYLDTSGLAPRLHPAALNLQLDMTSRMNRDELIRLGYLPSQKDGLSNALAPAAHSLNNKLKRRPTLSDLGARGHVSEQYVLDHETRADRKRRVSNALELRLRNRPTKEALADRAILDDSFLAPRLHPAAINLQSQLINQMSYEELVARGYITADAEVAKSLHGSMKTLEHKFRRRQSQADLQARGILEPTGGNLSHALAPAARAVAKGLKRRPSIDHLKQQNIMNDFDTNYMPASMINKAMAHQRARKTQKIEDLLDRRPDREEVHKILGDSNFISNDMAQSLRGAGHDLAKKLKRRPSVDDLTNRNILRNYALPQHMQAQASQLGFRQRKQSIATQLYDIQNKKRKQEALERIGLPTNIATTDHIQQVLEMNQMMFQEIKTLSSQVQVLQMTCNQLLMDKQKMRDNMDNFVTAQHQEMQKMAEYITENMKSSRPSPGADVRDTRAEAEIGQLKAEFNQAKNFFNQERTMIQQKEAALKNYMLEQEIQVVRLKGEYDVKIEKRPIGIRFEGIDNGRNLCVQGVLQKSAAEAYGVMPGDVVVRIRNRSVENQDAQETLDIFRGEQLPVIVRFRKHEAHTQLKDLWRRKREMLVEAPTGPPVTQQHQPGATKKRRDSGLIHNSTEQFGAEELLQMRRQMEAQIINLKQNVGGGIDPIVRAFEEMDTNQNGDLNLEEFINGLYRIGLGEGLSESQMKYAFKQMDDDGSGYIDYEEFEDFLKHSHSDAILDLVQKHIRERIATLIMQKRHRDHNRAASDAVRTEELRAQQRAAEEKAQMRAAYEAQQQAQRHRSVDGNNPKAWTEKLSESDQMRVQQLALTIRQILEEAHSWQSAVSSVRQHVSNLELEIANELYPLIKDRTQIDRKEIMRHALHVVDVLHTKIKNTQQSDPVSMESIDNLVQASRRYSTTEAAQQHMQQMHARAHGRAQDDDESSEEDEYDFGGVLEEENSSQQQAVSMRQLQEQLQINANMPPEMLERFAQQLNGNQELPVTPTRRYYASSPKHGVDPPGLDNQMAPPENLIDRRKSATLIAATPKTARPSIELTEEVTDQINDSIDSFKRAPETPRQAGSNQI